MKEEKQERKWWYKTRERQTDRESLNKTIEKDWAKKCNVLMFSLKVRDGKAFAVDSKIKEAKRCKKRLR